MQDESCHEAETGTAQGRKTPLQLTNEIAQGAQLVLSQGFGRKHVDGDVRGWVRQQIFKGWQMEDQGLARRRGCGDDHVLAAPSRINGQDLVTVQLANTQRAQRALQLRRQGLLQLAKDCIAGTYMLNMHNLSLENVFTKDKKHQEMDGLLALPCLRQAVFQPWPAAVAEDGPKLRKGQKAAAAGRDSVVAALRYS